MNIYLYFRRDILLQILIILYIYKLFSESRKTLLLTLKKLEGFLQSFSEMNKSHSQK